MAQFRVPEILDSREEMLACHDRIRQALQQPPPAPVDLETLFAIRKSCLFYLGYHGVDVRPFYEAFASFCRDSCPELAYRSSHCERRLANPSAGRKLRIGFISRYFFNHTVADFSSGLLTHLDRRRFHVVQIEVPHKSPRLLDAIRLLGVRSHLEALDEAMERTVRPQADQALILPRDLFEARRAVADLELDILFYLDIGMNSLTYFLAFSRLAPLQCTSWGHPVTSGLSTIDYFISAKDLEPPQPQRFYTEKLVTLTNLPTYYYRPRVSEERKRRQYFGLDGAAHVYLCPQSHFKLHPDFDEVLDGILREDPLGQIVLVESSPAKQYWQEKLWSRLLRTMPERTDRIRFVQRQSASDFLDLLNAADVLLDPLHFGGGKTTYDGLALGVPVVTLPGAFMRGRIAAACYEKMGITECTADSVGEYVRVAVGLGTSPERRQALRSKIVRGNSVLFENADAVREIEQCLLSAQASAL